MADDQGSKEYAYTPMLNMWVYPTLLVCLFFTLSMLVTGTVSHIGGILLVEIVIMFIQGKLNVCYAYWSTVATSRQLFIYRVFKLGFVLVFTLLFRFPFSSEIGWMFRDIIIVFVLGVLCSRHCKYSCQLMA